METTDVKTLQANVSDKILYGFKEGVKPEKRDYALDKARQALESRLRAFNNYVHAVKPIGLDYTYIILEVIKTILISDIKVDSKGIDEIYLMIADKVVVEMESKKEEIKKANDEQAVSSNVANRLIIPGRPQPRN